MTVYVDALIAWPQRAATAQARRIFGEGKRSCHMTTDGDLDELHAFAARIGMKRAWAQNVGVVGGFPHYDLTPARRAAAVAAGAVEVDRRGIVALIKLWRLKPIVEQRRREDEDDEHE